MIVIFVGAVTVGYILFSNQISVTGNRQTANTAVEVENVQEQSVVSSNGGLEMAFSTIEKTYGGQIPWQNLTAKQAYQFYPTEILGFPVATGEITVATDGDFNPITSLTFDNTSPVPVKNSYYGFYEVPELMYEQYNLDTFDIVFPVELRTYEFDRPLTQSEVAVISQPNALNCYNDDAELDKYSYSNTDVVMHKCELNPTAEQLQTMRYLTDHIYMIYFVDRNILIQIGFDTRYAENSQAYLDDYLSKIFNTNQSLSISEDQIESVADSRAFEEWRRETFDNPDNNLLEKLQQ